MPEGSTALWGPLVAAAVSDCLARATADRTSSSPTVAEALTEAAVTATVLQACESVPLRSAFDGLDADGIEAVTARRRLELAVGAVADLGTAVPGWRDGAGRALVEVLVLGEELEDWVRTAQRAGLHEAVVRVLATASFPSDRAEDLHESLEARCEALRPGLQTEWSASPAAHVTGLPLLTRPVADVVIAVLASRDPSCSDVALRRFHYRRFAEAVPEGLTDRHLVRSQELLHHVVPSVPAPAVPR